VTLPAPRYTYHVTCRPTFLPTVTLWGGSIARLTRCGFSALVSEMRASFRDPTFDTAEPDRPDPRRFGIPSSVTTADRVTVSPTLAVKDLRPCTSNFGGLLARISGLLLPAPSAPVSDARTTSSIL